MIREPLPWMTDAACSGTDPDAWFPEQDQAGIGRQAKRICQTCPVRDECLQYALDNDERFGIWGGLSEAQRARIRKETAA